MRRSLALAAITLAALVLPAAPAPGKSQEVHVRIHQLVVLADGNAITGRVHVACPRGWHLLEAGVTVSQDDQFLFGQSGLGVIPCDGKKRWAPFRVTAFDGAFHTGTARISAFVIVINEAETDTLSGGDTGEFRVR